ncbi:nucleoporin Ndc1 [Culicoides brevitarsis]|uniref:nucleoporin Ndc1 n=1 Tax=Culicoides brevitarsis TaxID=469753 RepID=UPI00307C3E4A
MEAKRLCAYRFTSATATCLLIQYLLLTFTVLIVNTNPLTPITWIFGTFRSMLRISTLFFLLPIGALTVANGVMLLLNYLSPKKPGEISKFLRKLTKVAFQFVTGLVLTWTFLRFLSEEYGRVLHRTTWEYNLKCVYLLLCGLVTVGHFISKRQTDVIEFPVLQQKKYLRIKTDFFTNFWKSLGESIFPSFLCALAVTTFMGISIWSKNLEKNNIFGLIIDYHLYFYTWLLFAYISCSLTMLKDVFEVFFSDYQQFPIEKPALIASDAYLTLADGLLYTKIPLIQTLAALDFFVLSQNYNTARRQELFSLSSVGGHPHNFRNVNEATLKVLQEFTKSLTEVIETKKVPTPVIANNNNALPVITSPVRDEKTEQRDMNKTLGIRNMVYTPIASPLKPLTAPPVMPEPKTPQVSLNCNVPSTLRSLFGEDKSKKVTQILANYSEKVTYLSQGIAAIAVFSLTEDKYGVVQDSLPKIIKTLLELHQILEKINAMNLVVAKKSNYSFIKARQAAKRSLYKMVKEFQIYFKDMVLERTTVEALRSFVV